MILLKMKEEMFRLTELYSSAEVGEFDYRVQRNDTELESSLSKHNIKHDGPIIATYAHKNLIWHVCIE